MKRKYLINGNSIKRNKRKAIREAFLPLMGQDASSDLILCAKGRNTLKISFITQERYKEMKQNNNAGE